MNIYNSNNPVKDDNDLYTSFNNFIFSDDRKLLHKLIYRHKFFMMTNDLPGDIVECGVFKGSGIFTWAKLIELYSPFEIKKVIGFDFFDQGFVESLSEKDREGMEQVFSRCEASQEEISNKHISDKLLKIGIKPEKFELVKGDISITSKEYSIKNPGFRISILYMDLDIEEPTLEALENFWERIVPGGVIVFDEYGYGVWTESNAVDKFVKKYKLKLQKTKVMAPSAYIVKE
jgi:hypothetical protein|tara:strand:- start:4829 stop:5524 length:696 start_codon:yes stop_codon:yes gene_type:complete